jgi:hypothetical protein
VNICVYTTHINVCIYIYIYIYLGICIHKCLYICLIPIKGKVSSPYMVMSIRALTSNLLTGTSLSPRILCIWILRVRSTYVVGSYWMSMLNKVAHGNYSPPSSSLITINSSKDRQAEESLTFYEEFYFCFQVFSTLIRSENLTF